MEVVATTLKPVFNTVFVGLVSNMLFLPERSTLADWLAAMLTVMGVKEGLAGWLMVILVAAPLDEATRYNGSEP